MMPIVKLCEKCHALLRPGATACPICGRVFSPTSSIHSPTKSSSLHHPSKPMPRNAIAGIVAAAVSFLVIVTTAVILFPVFYGAHERSQDEANSWVSLHNLSEIGEATVKYERDHNNRLPPMDSMDHFKAALARYDRGYDQSQYSLFVEPGTNRPYVLVATLSNKNVPPGGFATHVVIAYEAVPHVEFRYIYNLYSDGDVEQEISNQ